MKIIISDFPDISDDPQELLNFAVFLRDVLHGAMSRYKGDGCIMALEFAKSQSIDNYEDLKHWGWEFHDMKPDACLSLRIKNDYQSAGAQRKQMDDNRLPRI